MKSLSRKSIRGFLILVSATLLSLAFQNCRPSGFEAIPFEDLNSNAPLLIPTLSFSDIDQKIIQPKCIACHSGGTYDFSSYSKLMNTGTVTAGNPAQSPFYQALENGSMPSGGPRLSSSDLQMVSDWITGGALQNLPSTPTPTTTTMTTTTTLPTGGGSTAPDAVTGLTASAVTQTSVTLTWNLPAGNLKSADVERSSSLTGPFTVIKTLIPAASTYTDSGLTAATAYYYRVRVSNDQGDSPYSSVLMTTTAVMTPPAGGTPMAPSTLKATAASATQIDLSWMDNSNNESGFKVEKAMAATGPFTQVATLPAGSKSFSDTGLSAVMTYYYRVTAYNSNGSSFPTALASATTFGTFSWVSKNILQPRCVACHGGSNPVRNYDVSTYNGTLVFVSPGHADTSDLYLRTSNGTMPPSGSPLTAIQLEAIKTWINSGAANN